MIKQKRESTFLRIDDVKSAVMPSMPWIEAYEIIPKVTVIANFIHCEDGKIPTSLLHVCVQIAGIQIEAYYMSCTGTCIASNVVLKIGWWMEILSFRSSESERNQEPLRHSIHLHHISLISTIARLLYLIILTNAKFYPHSVDVVVVNKFWNHFQHHLYGDGERGCWKHDNSILILTPR